jgi:hypothetical protein
MISGRIRGKNKLQVMINSRLALNASTFPRSAMAVRVVLWEAVIADGPSIRKRSVICSGKKSYLEFFTQGSN